MRRYLTFIALVAMLGLALSDAIWPKQPELLIDESVSAAPLARRIGATSPVEASAVKAEAKVIKPPPDPVGRAKFPNEDPAVVDALAIVNQSINQMIKPVEDAKHYGVEQVMVSFPPDMKGDCEDYALTKLVMLEQAGLPVPAFARLRFVYVVDAKGGAFAHALLEVRMPKGGIALLDNNFNALMTRGELEARGYQFFDW